MVASNHPKQLTQTEKRIFTAIRESILQDPRIEQIEEHPNLSVTPDDLADSVRKEPDDFGQKESDRPAATDQVTKPFIELTRPEVGENNPEVSENNDDMISSPSIAPPEPLAEPNLENESPPTHDISRGGPSAARRLLRTCAWGVFVIGVVGAGFALLAYESQVKQILFGARDYLASIQSDPASGAGSPKGSEPTLAIFKPSNENKPSNANKPSDEIKSSDEKPTDHAASVVPATTTPAKSGGTESSDLADVRRLLEQMLARQEQMAQDIAALQAAEKTINQQLSTLTSPPESPAVRTPARRPMQSRGRVR